MPATQPFKNLVFRVHLNPAPRTQSESNAVFHVLRDYGPIHAFKIHHHLPAHGLNAHKDKMQRGISASLVFAHNTKSVDELWSDKQGHRFTVIANKNIPDPAVKDPYNVRGLQSRKPELKSRAIECFIMPVEEEEDRQEDSVLAALKTNPYSDGFAVDRNSIFAEILARTDCPSGLIHGLLPKLSDEHRSAAFDQGLMQKDITQTGLEAERSTWRQREVYFRKLDLAEANSSPPAEAAVTQQEDAIVNGNLEDKVVFHDEFADLRDVSLMQMYRDATRADRSQTKGAATTFIPFVNKS